MDARVDPYAVLGISPDSEDVVIRAAYRALMEKYSRGIRPDAWEKQRARDVDAAYAVLRDPASRRAHDRRQEAIPRQETAAPAASVAAPRPSATPPRAPAPPVRRRSGGRTAAIALVAIGLALVGWLATHRRPAQSEAGTPRGLTIRKRYPTTSVRLVRPLPCYVNGQPVGQLLLRDCASRNGVATGPLDVALASPAPPAKLPHSAAAPAPAESATAAPAPERPVEPPPRPVFANPPKAFAEARPPPPPRPAQPPTPLRRPAFAPPSQEFADAGPPPTDPTAERPRFVGMRPETGPYPANSPAEAMGVVRAFYAALGDGDGDRAAALVTPEKRGVGAFSAPAMTRFYSSLRRPLRLMQLYPLDDSTVFARYRFVTADGRRCFGAANVTTTQRGGVTLVRGIRAYNGC